MPLNMVKAESSKDAESNGIKAQTDSATASYELPWFVGSLSY